MPTYTLDGERPDNSGKLEHLSGAAFPALPSNSMVPTPTPAEILAIKTANYTRELSVPPKQRPDTIGPPLGTPDNYIIGVELSKRGLAYIKTGCDDTPSLLDIAILCIAVQRRTPAELISEVQLQYKRTLKQGEIFTRLTALAQHGWLTLHRNGKKGRQQ